MSPSLIWSPKPVIFSEPRALIVPARHAFAGESRSIWKTWRAPRWWACQATSRGTGSTTTTHARRPKGGPSLMSSPLCTSRRCSRSLPPASEYRLPDCASTGTTHRLHTVPRRATDRVRLGLATQRSHGTSPRLSSRSSTRSRPENPAVLRTNSRTGLRAWHRSRAGPSCRTRLSFSFGESAAAEQGRGDAHEMAALGSAE